MNEIRCLRSYRRLMMLCLTIGINVCLYCLSSTSRKTSESSLNILSNKIDERLHLLIEHFNHVNISMLLNRPSSDESLSITYRCQELCGGCKNIKYWILLQSKLIILFNFKGVIESVV